MAQPILKTFTILREDILSEVSKTTAYFGAQHLDAQGRNIYALVATTPERAEMLQRFFEEASSTLVEGAGPYAATVTLDATRFEATIRLPLTANQAYLQALKSLATSFIVAYIVSRWYALCALTADAEAQSASARSFLQTFRRYIYKRIHPAVPEPPARTDATIGQPVDSTINRDIDTADNSSNTIGQTIHQQFGPIRIEHYTYKNRKP